MQEVRKTEFRANSQLFRDNPDAAVHGALSGVLHLHDGTLTELRLHFLLYCDIIEPDLRFCYIFPADKVLGGFS